MKFRIANRLTAQIPTIARRCAYVPILDKRTGKQSFVRKLTRERYPRFHLYIEQKEKEVIFDAHLDQSKTRYDKQTAHNADYESEEVKAELTRVYQIVSEFLPKS